MMWLQTLSTTWLVYLGAVTVFLLVCVWVLWHRSAAIKYPVLMLLAVLVLMPWPVMSEHAAMAPAWIVVLFDALLQDGADPWRAGLPLTAVSVLCLMVGVFMGQIRRRKK